MMLSSKQYPLTLNWTDYAVTQYSMFFLFTFLHRHLFIKHVHVVLTGLPMTYGLRIFDAPELKLTPFKFVLCMALTL